MPCRLQRLRIAPDAITDVRAWLDEPTSTSTIAAHRLLGLWVEHVFLVESSGGWHLYLYGESGDPETISERAAAVTDPEFVALRQRFAGWFDEAEHIPYIKTIDVR